MSVFQAADLLLPRAHLLKDWPVIACDQFTSQPEYWQQVAARVAGKPSAYEIIFPEALLGQNDEARIAAINAAMGRDLAADCFRRLPDSLIYVERTLQDGTIRQGLVGVIDLEAYDFAPKSDALIRATERTVEERIPPRVRIREAAPLETSHVLLLCDDDRMEVLESAAALRDTLPVCYDLELMQGGGHLTGWQVTGDALEKVGAAVARYEARMAEKYRDMGIAPILYAVGDGNHSLATAKVCWERRKAALSPEEAKAHPARYAMVELENLLHEAQRFEAIHRVVRDVNPAALVEAAQTVCAAQGMPVPWVAGEASGTLTLNPALGELPVGILQSFLDAYVAEHGGTMDYIHGAETAERLAEVPGQIAFLLPAIDKAVLFTGLAKDGVLPRKTFSMGHAEEKRYYLECREIV